MRDQRKRIWIDPYQTHLFLRIVTYCGLYQAAVWTFVALERSLVTALEEVLGQGATFGFYLVMAVGAIVLGAAFVYDALTIAHRVVGPIHRIRKVIQAITAGDELELMSLRKGDYLQEVQDDFNEMLKVLERHGAVTLKAPAAEARPQEPVSA